MTPRPTSISTTVPSSRPTSDGVGDGNDSGSGGGNSKEFTTPNIDEATGKAKGVVFTITAKSKDILITSLGIVGVGKNPKKSDIQVYSHAGSYEDSPDDRRGRGKGKGKGSNKEPRSNMAAWNEYFEDKVELKPHEIVDVKLDEEITIRSGETASVYVVSKRGVSYKESTSDEFDVSAENDDFVLKVGATTRKEFKRIEKLADFAGRIVYQTGILA